MSTFTYDTAPTAAEAPVRKRRSIFARALDALIAAQMRRAEEEVARHRHLMPVLTQALEERIGEAPGSARPR